MHIIKYKKATDFFFHSKLEETVISQFIEIYCLSWITFYSELFHWCLKMQNHGWKCSVSELFFKTSLVEEILLIPMLQHNIVIFKLRLWITSCPLQCLYTQFLIGFIEIEFWN